MQGINICNYLSYINMFRSGVSDSILINYYLYVLNTDNLPLIFCNVHDIRVTIDI